MTSMRSLLAAYATNHACSFLLKEREISPSEVFSAEMFLPIVAFDAEFQARRLLGLRFDSSFLDDRDALIGKRVHVPDVHIDDTTELVRSLFFMHSANRIFGVELGGVIDCTPVLRFYQSADSNSDRYFGNLDKSVRWPLAQRVR